jgi:BirA family transcriptional regulator, biotin operon repressor / biotin---[acetyl-CoA-carboxylase] ligase
MKESAFVKKTKEFSKRCHSNLVKELLVFDTLDSTNSTAKAYANAGAAEGTIVIAKTQSQGRGRFDRIWESPEGGMYLSLILRPAIPPQKASLLPLITALALAKTIEPFGFHVTIKWPNDVRVKNKKIAGILLESELKGHTLSFVVVGIGINLNTDITKLSADVQQRSTSLSSEKGSAIHYHEFLRTFLIQFEREYTRFLKKDETTIIEEWKTYTDTLGKTIQIKTSTETIQGIAVDVDESGFLLLRTENGEIKKIMSGDCLYFNEL